MTTTALAVAQPASPSIAIADAPSFAQPRNMAELRQIAEMAYSCGLFKDLKSVGQGCMKILAGSAMGYDVVTSLNAFHIIEGKLALTAGEVGARIKRSGKYNYRVTTINETQATIVFMERDSDKWMDIGTSDFTVADSVKAGVSGNPVWKKYPRNMLFSRALTNGARWFTPDVFGGPVYTPEELGATVDINAEGEMFVIDGTAKPIADTKSARLVAPKADEFRGLYANARKIDPSLPEDVKAWASSVTPTYDGKRNPRATEMLEWARRLDDLLAEGTTIEQKPTQEPVQEAVVAEPSGSLFDAPAATEAPQTVAHADEQEAPATITTSRAVGATSAAHNDSNFPPDHDGVKMTRDSQARLFAVLKEAGVGQEGTDEEKRRERISYVSAFGLDIDSFTKLSDGQARWVAQKVHDEMVCVCCGARLIDSQPHAVGCLEVSA